MGLFDGIADAETFERGKFFPPGFRGKVRIERTIAKESVKSGIGFICEVRIIEVDRPGQGYNPGDAESEIPKHEKAPVVQGEKRTWWQGMTDKTVAFPALKSWAAAVAGYTLDQKELIESEVSPHLQDALMHATDNPADNDFVSVFVNLETWNTTTKKGGDFTVHDWTPYNEAEPEPTDAVDEIGATG